MTLNKVSNVMKLRRAKTDMSHMTSDLI